MHILANIFLLINYVSNCINSGMTFDDHMSTGLKGGSQLPSPELVEH